MAERVPKITQAERPTFDAATYSDRLQETRTAATPLPPVAVFDKSKPASIVPLARYVAGKLTDTVNALTDFTASHEIALNAQAERIAAMYRRLNELEAARVPFGSRSG